MRLLIVPFILVAFLVQVHSPALGNNQEAAEKIAGAIGKQFPEADIDVAYQGGKVWLKGDAVSSDQRKQIAEHVRNITGVNVTEVNDEIQIVAPRPVTPQIAAPRPVVSALTQPVPMPVHIPTQAAPNPRARVGSGPGVRPRVAEAQQQLAQQQFVPQQHHSVQQPITGADLAQYPLQHYPAAYGLRPGQQPVQQPGQSYPYMPGSFVQVEQPLPIQHGQQYTHQHGQQPVYYGPPTGAAYHPEAYGPQGPMPGQYNHPNLPDYAWPAYANYPNYAQVSYPRSYSPKAWPYIGPFHPYPQVPMGWRKVTLEHSNGWWWLDFNDGTPTGPFSALFRHPQQYCY